MKPNSRFLFSLSAAAAALVPRPVRAEEPAAPVPGAVERAAPPPAATSASVRKEEVFAKLDNLKITLDFTDTPLADVLDFIRDFSGIDFVIDPKVTERFSADQLKVSLKVRDLPLRSALKLLLAGKNLAALYREGVLVVVPKEEVDRQVTLRLYDVRDLLMKVQDFSGPVIELKPPSQGGGLAGAQFALEEEPKILTEEFIVDIVKNNCGGATWEENPNTSIALNNGLLMVVQSKRVHADIQQLIGLLRQYK